MHIYIIDFGFCVLLDFCVCKSVHFCVCVCFLSFFIGSFSSVYSFVFSYSGLFIFILSHFALLFLDACLYSNEKERGEWGGVGGVGKPESEYII